MFLDVLFHRRDERLLPIRVVNFIYTVQMCVADISNSQYFRLSTLIQVPSASDMLQFVCVDWCPVTAAQRVTVARGGGAESSVRGDRSYEQRPRCPVPPPPFILRQAHCKESPRTLRTRFSPWEISDINRSTCLPYNR